MVRLVFRPYTQIRRSICTSESLRASTWVSSGFTLFRHSSPSFGSQQIRSYSNLSGNHPDRSMMQYQVVKQDISHLRAPSAPLLSLRLGAFNSKTCVYVRLLGPCFKTGRMKPFRQCHKHVSSKPRTLNNDMQHCPLEKGHSYMTILQSRRRSWI